MQEETSGSGLYAAVVQVTHYAAYKYQYRVWCAEEFLEEKHEREVIPSKKRELVVEKFGGCGERKNHEKTVDVLAAKVPASTIEMILRTSSTGLYQYWSSHFHTQKKLVQSYK